MASTPAAVPDLSASCVCGVAVLHGAVVWRAALPRAACQGKDRPRRCCLRRHLSAASPGGAICPAAPDGRLKRCPHAFLQREPRRPPAGPISPRQETIPSTTRGETEGRWPRRRLAGGTAVRGPIPERSPARGRPAGGTVEKSARRRECQSQAGPTAPPTSRRGVNSALPSPRMRGGVGAGAGAGGGGQAGPRRHRNNQPRAGDATTTRDGAR